MAVCESHLESGLSRLNREGSDDNSQERTLPAALPLTVDYRSPVAHFVPPAVELYAARQRQDQLSSAESSETSTPVKRKRGRPRVDKTSPEYLANLAARKQAREMAAMSRAADTPPGTKRKRGRPRVDKTSPEYLARKRQRELEALERKAKREYKRRSTGDSVASSSAGDGTNRVKRKYTKRTPSAKKNDGESTPRVKGKRGRPRKDANAQLQPKIRVRSNLMPMNNEPISLDSDDEPDLGSPGAASDSLSLDENLRALRHIHEKYANIDKEEMLEAHLVAAQYKYNSAREQNPGDEDVLSLRSSTGSGSVQDLDQRVEKLEDSSNSDSDTSSSGSSTSGSSSSSSSGSSDSSDSSDTDSETENPTQNDNHLPQNNAEYAPPLWAARGSPPGAGGAAGSEGGGSGSESDPERAAPCAAGPPPELDDISESDNESPDKSFQCHICKKWYSTRVTLKIHRRSHQNRGGSGARPRQRATDRYECDICNATFPRREKLYQHRSEAHRGAMTSRCEVCRRGFERDEELAPHEAAHTPDERNGRCSECGLTFPRYEQLRRHRSAAHPGAAPAPPGGAGVPAAGAPPGGGMPHACAHCGKRFSHVHSLTRHLQNHAKQLYRCVVCKASFARADQLAQHLNSHLANYKRLKP